MDTCIYLIRFKDINLPDMLLMGIEYCSDVFENLMIYLLPGCRLSSGCVFGRKESGTHIMWSNIYENGLEIASRWLLVPCGFCRSEMLVKMNGDSITTDIFLSLDYAHVYGYLCMNATHTCHDQKSPTRTCHVM